MSESCVLDVTAWTERKRLYAPYKTWAQSGGRFPVSAATFYDQPARGYPGVVVKRTREGVRGFAGIRLAEAKS